MNFSSMRRLMNLVESATPMIVLEAYGDEKLAAADGSVHAELVTPDHFKYFIEVTSGGQKNRMWASLGDHAAATLQFTRLRDMLNSNSLNSEQIEALLTAKTTDQVPGLN